MCADEPLEQRNCALHFFLSVSLSYEPRTPSLPLSLSSYIYPAHSLLEIPKNLVANRKKSALVTAMHNSVSIASFKLLISLQGDLILGFSLFLFLPVFPTFHFT